MPDPRSDAASCKQALRVEAKARRRRLADRMERSLRICRTVAALPEFAAAQTVMLYLSMPDEVQTDALVAACRETAKRVVVPYCAADSLHLFILENDGELAAGVLGIREPRVEFRTPARSPQAESLGLIVVPGVAFDHRGGRVGHGKGYYDRFLAALPARTFTVAVAFECQVFERVPMVEGDVAIKCLVTEEAMYRGGV